MDPYGYDDPSDDDENDDMAVEEEEDDDDDNNDDEHHEHHQQATLTNASSYLASPVSQYAEKEPRYNNDNDLEDGDDDDDEDDDENDDDDEDLVHHHEQQETIEQVQRPAQPQPRGKPEAMTANIMRAKAAAERLEEDDYDSSENDNDNDEDDDDDDDDDDGAAQAAVVVATEEDAAEEEEAPASARPAPVDHPAAKPAAPRKRTATKMKSASLQRSRPTSPATDYNDGTENLLTETISEREYQNLDSLMEQFCRVPLLAEFSRPVNLLHPEVRLVGVHGHCRLRWGKTVQFGRLDTFATFFSPLPLSKKKHSNLLTVGTNLCQDCESSSGFGTCLSRNSSSTVSKHERFEIGYVAGIWQLCQVSFPPQQSRKGSIVCVHRLAFA